MLKIILIEIFFLSLMLQQESTLRVDVNASNKMLCKMILSKYEDLSNLYGIPADDILANLASMGFGPDGEFIPLAQGGEIDQYYLGGSTDGMADDIPAMIGNSQPAALSDGEFVIPADVVSHLGNGNSDAGAQNLYSMMDRVRKDRTGNPNQGKQIDPNQYLA